VGSRLDEDTLWLWVRSPQSRKRGTLMPGLFSNAEGDDEKVEAIATYLSSLKKAAPAMPAGDALRGKTLYHQVGCVACHQPANDVAPPGVAGGEEFEKPGNASVPIALADAWEINSLAAFLHDPLPLRPAGRMPAQALTQQEAADIAAYLHIEPKVPNAEQRKLLDIPKQSPQRGAELMKEMRCNNCHSADKTAHHAALPMVALRASAAGSCLDAGQVRYGLNDLQRRALALALSHLQKNEPTTADLLSASNFTMMRLNCYACHDYDGKGGPELPRAAYFSTTPDTLPPTLDGIGSRLSVEALQDRVWHGKGPKNAALQLRMPIFGQQPTQGLLKDLARQPQ
jgi:cytochrome c2